MEDFKMDKKEQLLRAKCDKLKKKIRDWEQAIYKTEGRCPTRDDMKQAPKEVQESYRNFVKLKKYLEDFDKREKKNHNVLTPGKLFLGNHRSERQRPEESSSSSRAIRTSSTRTSKEASREKSAEPRLKPSLGLRSSRNSQFGKKKVESPPIDESSQSKGPFSFKKLYNAAEDSDNSKLDSSTVTLGSSADLETSSMNLSVELALNESVERNANSEPIKWSDKLWGDTSNSSKEKIGGGKLGKNSAGNDENNSNSARFLKSPMIKDRLTLGLGLRPSSKKLDFGWLSRLNVDGEGEVETENQVETETISTPSARNDGNEADTPANVEETAVGKTPSSANQLNSSTESMGFHEANSSTSMEVDSDEAQATTTTTPTSAYPMFNENTDSGIGVHADSLFNPDEVNQAVQEVLQETGGILKGSGSGGGTASATVSDADRSLLYSLTEDAYLPSDPEDYSFGVDENTISNLIDTLDDAEPKSSPHGEEMEFEDQSISNGRKRSASFAFSPSPSPEKNSKKKKFFKSNRGDRKILYSTTSYKPPSPQKRTTRCAKAIMNTPTTPKLILRKVVTDDENSNQDMWTSKFAQTSEVEGRNLDSIPEHSNSKTKTNSEESPKSKPKSKSPRVTKKGKAKTTKSKSTKSSPGRARAKPRPRKQLNYEEEEEDNEASEDKGNAQTDQDQTTTRKNVIVDIFDEQVPGMSSSGGRRKGGAGGYKGRRKKTLETLDSKMKSGKVDENFVRIDLRRKVFVRGHKKISAVRLKRLEWKQKKSAKDKEDTSSLSRTYTCHKCGEKGHFAKFCTKDNNPLAITDEPPGEEDDSPLPTLEEAARMVYKNPNDKTMANRINIYDSSKLPTFNEDSQNQKLGELDPLDMDVACAGAAEQPVVTVPKLIETLDPLFEANGETEISQFEDNVILEGLQKFGYSSFRPGQKEAIYRVLKGLSTLLILSTGSGKSLCYQLPAYLYAQKYPGALTLCISPLVSLMEDQILGIPEFLSAGCLHSNMSTKQKDVVLEKVKSRQLNILLVSPEAVCGGLFGLLRGTPESLPRIGFACIDEVHCVSQWSHNFRPSYLQLCKILREKLNVKTILGLTATATKTTAQSICEHLSISPDTAIRGELIPPNLQLSVSRDVYKDEALVNLLQGDRLKDCDSIIIYCTRREVCERIATLIRTKLQTISMNKIMKTKSRGRLSCNCEAYHAGMTPRRRKNVQDGFMSGDIRIVVATVAFGMGIDKSDIRAVIHYNMPSAFESYVQEIGRAGRDGLPAHCHLFLDNAKRNDLNELKRHVYANSVDRPTIRKLLRKIFQKCKCERIRKLRGTSSEDNSNSEQCEGHEVAFSIDKCVTDLDLPKENITTLLCYLELDEKKWIEQLPLTYETCKIQSYGGPKLIKTAALRCPPLAVALAILKEKNKYRDQDPFISFNVIEVAATVGWSSSVVKKELKNLEWTGSQFDDKGNPIRYRKSGLLVEFSDLAYRVKSRGSLSDEEADEVLNTLHNRNVSQEQTQIYQLHRVYEALLSVSFPSISSLCDTFDEDKSSQLKKFIHEYFSEDCISFGVTHPGQVLDPVDMNAMSDKVEDLRRTIRHLIQSNRDTPFTTRSVAKILQGISSPNFPADLWYKSREFWRKYMDLDFHFICKIAAEEI